MKPTIGTIVIYHCNEEEEKKNNFQKDAPAVITAVWGENCVNLKVLLDGIENLWKTSCVEASGENCWSWPVIDWPVIEP